MRTHPSFFVYRLEIRPYMFEILMYLVQVHEHVATVSKSLLERTLNALVEGVAEEALRCFRQVKKFGMGGMLRVRTADIFSAFFIHFAMHFHCSCKFSIFSFI